MKKETREVLVNLSQSEILERAKAAGDLSERISVMEEDLKLYVKDKKDEIKDFKSELKELLTAIRKRKSLAVVKCDVNYDSDNDIVEYIYDDTIVDTRPMTLADRQRELL